MDETTWRIGAYEVIGKLGSGGMGTVYLGRDPELDRPVAIKVLSGEIYDDLQLQRFFREARAAAALRHENIVTIYASGRHGRQPFIAMEVVDGASLADVIGERRPLRLSERLSHLRQICSGLHVAHRAGIVHRDVKPGNLMVDREGRIRILDFGIAHVEGSGMTQDGALIGTLNYMSPEQMLGRPIDHRSDIFSVGAVAYELLSGQKAFKGTIGDGLLQRLPVEDPMPLVELGVGVPADLDRIVMKALRKAPGDRFQDLTEMADALEAVRQRIVLDPAIDVLPAGATSTGGARATALPDARTTMASGDPRTGAASSAAPSGVTAVERRGRRMAAIAGAAAIVALVAVAAVLWSRPGARVEPPVSVDQTPAIPGASLADATQGSDSTDGGGSVPPQSELTRTPAPPVPAAEVPPVESDPRGPAPTQASAASASRAGGAPPAPERPPAPATTDAGTPALSESAASPVVPPSPGSPIPSPGLTEADTDVQDLLARTRAMYTQGDLAGALNVLTRRSDLLGDARVGDLASRVAGAAFEAMQSAERAAASRDAATRAPDAFQAASGARQRAQTLLEQDDAVNAGLQALAARDGFQAAAASALAAPPPAATADVATPPVAAPALSRSDQEGIFAALGAFRAAYHDRSLEALLKVYPSIRREDRQRIEADFRNCRAYEVTFSDEQLLIDPANPDRVQVTLRGRYACTVRTGQPPAVADSRDVFVLRKAGDLWLIDQSGVIR